MAPSHALALGFLAFLAVTTTSLAAETQYGARRSLVEVDGHKGFVIHPEKPRADGSRPWVWYAPTFTNVYPNARHAWMMRQLLAAGIAIAGIDVGESYGSPDGRIVYNRFHRRMVDTFDLDRRATLLAQSRGGLMLYNWAAENPNHVRAIVGIYPVCDLRSYPGLPRAAGAYGLDAAGLEAAACKHNPIERLGPIARADIPILHIHGDSDTIVPLEANSGVVYERYRQLGGRMKLIVVPGKGHAEVDEFFKSPQVMAFLLNPDSLVIDK